MSLNSYNMMFTSIMILGVMISLSSNNLFMIWLGLEITFMSFMPTLSKSTKLMSHSSMKYFIIQSISSLMMMLGMLMMLNDLMHTNFILMFSLIIKIALAPFHTWLIMIIDNMNVNSMFMLITIMKFPLINLISIMMMKFDLLCMFSMICSSLCSLNQTSIRKLIAYSSVFNMGLLMPSLMMNSSWINFMTIYSLILLSMFILINKCNINFINQTLINEHSIMLKINMFILLISMGGMPPLMGFTLKLIIIEKLTMVNNYMMIMTISITSVIMMFIYIRLSFLIIMFSSIKNKWNLNIINKNSMIIFIMNLTWFPILILMKCMT
uniref:NADH-ubiquinone oxidoreductase chain 2 n=1 Tax=Mesargus serrata TaxID=2901391 RepID=A0A8K2AU08_9HEMI|nr:NADH dehydrogenase subunit 2 [Mesargus serrata]